MKWLVTALLLLAVPVHAESLQAGVSVVDITPPAGIEMWGAAGRKGFAEGELDPLRARTLVLKTAGVSIALVTLDLGRTFSLDQMNRVRRRVRDSVGIQYVIFSASHTHTGPNILDDAYIENPKERWEPDALERIGQGIEDAARRMTASRIGIGIGASYIGHNRQDGPVRILGKNLTGVRTSPYDPIVTVIRVDNLRGEPLAILAHYATHPVVLNHVTRFSADYPGAMSEYVEKKWNSKTVCFFLQGGCGDINSHNVAVGGLVDEARKAGYALGKVVEQVSRGIRTSDSEAALQIVEDEMIFPARWDLEKLKRLDAPPTYHQWLATGRPIGYPSAEVRVNVTTLLVNRTLAFVTMPGEPYVDLQIDLRDKLPEVTAVLLGYTNGYVGYLPTMRAATRDGVFYGANAWPTIVPVGAPERMIDRGVIRVLEFLGKLQPRKEKQ